jgi:hypothetical protein
MPKVNRIGPKLCGDCGESDETKFTPCIFNICKDCKKLKNPKEYKCKYCDATDKTLFYENRYTNCRKCYNGRKGDKTNIERCIEEKHSEESTVDKVIMNDNEIRRIIKQTINYDVSIMMGYTIRQTLDDLKINSDSNKDEIESLKEENSRLKYENFKILSMLEDLNFKIDASYNCKK